MTPRLYLRWRMQHRDCTGYVPFDTVLTTEVLEMRGEFYEVRCPFCRWHINIHPGAKDWVGLLSPHERLARQLGESES